MQSLKNVNNRLEIMIFKFESVKKMEILLSSYDQSNQTTQWFIACKFSNTQYKYNQYKQDRNFKFFLESLKLLDLSSQQIDQIISLFYQLINTLFYTVNQNKKLAKLQFIDKQCSEFEHLKNIIQPYLDQINFLIKNQEQLLQTARAAQHGESVLYFQNSI